MPTPIKSLGEVALQVSDLDTMAAFYADVVGLELLRRFPDNGPVFFKIADGVDGHTQVLALFDRGARPAAEWRRPPLDHIAFSLSLPDLERERLRLIALGHPPSETTHAWVQWRSLYIDDPEGNVVEWVAFDAGVTRDA